METLWKHLQKYFSYLSWIVSTYFDFSTLLFILEKNSTLWKLFFRNWNWKPQENYKYSVKKLKLIWSISKLVILIQILFENTFNQKNCNS